MKNSNIERNVTLNHENRTIEITKQFKKAACRFGSEEYRAIKEAVDAHPNYRVVTKTVKRTDSYKGLTFDFMEKYIKAHDDENKSILAEFNELRAKSEEAVAMGFDSMTYGEIKKWFFETFPEIEAFQKRREAILNKSVA